MAKNKKKLAERIFHKKSIGDKNSVNPFEVHINKQKYQVLGQKSKHDHGLPGVSRAKAIRKRKETLLPEYNVKNKSNKFIDRRIGERNFSMSEEDRTMARFTAEKLRHHNRKSIYNLDDDEVLTHRGQTLHEIEKFDDPRSDNDDDDMDDEGRKSSGKLDDDFVGDAHFGGGILTKTGKEGAKTHKELIDQLIAESKKRKAEKQKTKEETSELTEKLDSEWKDLLPLVNKNNKDEESKPEVHQKPDNYDKIMRELKFEARGNPTDRLKSEDEIAKEEKERLEKLEEDRRNRMLGIIEKAAEKVQHRSADDLDDNFNFDSDPEETLAYDEEGNVRNKIEIEANEEENQIEEEEQVQEEESSEEETDDDLSDLKESDDDSDEEDENNSNKIETNANEVKGPNKIKTNEVRVEKKSPPKIETNVKIVESKLNNANKVEITISDDNTAKDDSEINSIMEKAKKELPYTYTVPDSYESFHSLVNSQLPEYQNVIIERMIKCTHPSLAAENKNHLHRLFIYLLQYLNDVSPEKTDKTDNIKLCFKILNIVVPHLYNLTHLNPENVRDSFIEVIKEKQQDYRKNMKQFPGLDVLVFLKLVSCLFSTSDFRHQIVTPSFVFISQMLTNCKVKTRYDAVYGLFLITLFLEYTSISKRYLPAAVTFLTGLVHMAVPKIGVRVIKIHPPFRPNSTSLVLTTKHTKNKTDLQMIAEDFILTEFDEKFKIKSLFLTLKLIKDLQENWKALPSDVNIFKAFYDLLEKVPAKNYPTVVQNQIEDATNCYKTIESNKKLNYLMMQQKKPKALRLYEPNIQQVFEFKRFKPMSRERADKEKLLHKYKKETKGALREIRRDKSFLGRVKIKQQLQSDYERREKVKRIYAEASMQQSELNALDRKKKK